LFAILSEEVLAVSQKDVQQMKGMIDWSDNGKMDSEKETQDALKA